MPEILLLYATPDAAESAYKTLLAIDGINAYILHAPIRHLPPAFAAGIRVVRYRQEPVTLPEAGAIATMF